MVLISIVLGSIAVGVALAGAPVTVPISKSAKALSIPAGIRAKANAAQRVSSINNRIKAGNPARSLLSTSTQSTSAPLTNVENFLYLANVTLSDGKTWPIDLDTGSSDVWFRTAYCYSPDSSCDVNYSNATNGALYREAPFYFVDTYGLGAAAGVVGYSNVTLGGLNAEILVGLAILLVEQQQGLLGLAFSSLGVISSSVTPYVHVSGNWFDALNLDNPVFGFYLSDYDDGDFGEITLGGYDSEKYTGDITWQPLVNITEDYLGNPSPGYWTFSLLPWTWSVPGTGASGAIGSPETPYAIADTGTTLLIVPNAVALGVFTALNVTYDNDPEVEDYVIPCTNSLPPIVFSYEGTDFSIPSEIYTLFAGTDSLGNDVCIPGITGGGDGISIFGDIFLRSYYSLYDKKNIQLGFAKAVHSTTSSSSSTTASATATSATSGSATGSASGATSTASGTSTTGTTSGVTGTTSSATGTAASSGSSSTTASATVSGTVTVTVSSSTSATGSVGSTASVATSASTVSGQTSVSASYVAPTVIATTTTTSTPVNLYSGSTRVFAAAGVVAFSILLL
ncbi:hypothetical protein HK100_002418 [Physocladia obscura]|uniref:Peptidase A1 domain-containing protein n=1 Tax=Physocladia obscura TaxID=109957 RepID=A0AAD5SX42_9FUNG|nr:hypothetical protein HK100_002418 [Physocladia obscura]